MKQSGSCIEFNQGWGRQAIASVQPICEKRTVDEAKQNIQFNHSAIVKVDLSGRLIVLISTCILHAAIMIEHSIGSRAKNCAY